MIPSHQSENISSPQSGWPRILKIAALVLILVGAACARTYKLGSMSLWADEFISLEVSAGHGYEHLDFPHGKLITPGSKLVAVDPARGLADVYRLMARSTHPPLYFFLLRIWREIFTSDSDGTLRGLSALISVLGVLAAFDAVRTMHGTSTALWSAAVLAVANPQVEYAQEARGYALLVATMFATCAVAARIIKYGPSTRRLALLFVSSTAMILSHYLGFAVIAALAIYTFIELKDRAVWKKVMLTLSGSMAAFALFWGPILVKQLGEFSQHLAWMNEQSEGRFSRVIWRLTSLPLQFFSDAGTRPGRYCSVALLLFVLPIFFLRKHPQILLWCLIVWINVFAIASFDMARASYALSIRRYTLAAAAAANVLAVVMMMHAPGRLRFFAPPLLVIACSCALPLSYLRLKPNWRPLGQFVESESHRDGAIVFYPHNEAEAWYAGVLYLGISHYSSHIDCPIIVLTSPADQSLVHELEARDPVLIVSGSKGATEILPGCCIQAYNPFPFIASCSRVDLPEPAPDSAAALSRSPQLSVEFPPPIQ